MRIIHRFTEAARAGWHTAQRTWAASAIADQRQRDQRLRLAGMTDRELLRASTRWAGAVCTGELRRRGLPVPGEVRHG